MSSLFFGGGEGAPLGLLDTTVSHTDDIHCGPLSNRIDKHSFIIG